MTVFSIFFRQPVEAIQNLFNDLAGFDIYYEEIRELCREARKKICCYLKVKKLDKLDSEKCIVSVRKKNANFSNLSLKQFEQTILCETE